VLHFDWTINLTTILSGVWLLLFSIVIGPIRKFVTDIRSQLTELKLLIEEIRGWLKEYPPHRHAGGEIVFPKGMNPDKG